jgi:hypothetical protein
MNRGFGRSFLGRVLLAVLCSFFLFASAAIAAERKVRILTIDSATWSSDLVASEPQPDTRIETTNCVLGPVPAIAPPPDGASIVRDIGTLQCFRDEAPAHIAELTIRSGDATIFTQATYRDAAGDFNTVTIPEITTTLPASPTSSTLRFERIESTTDRSTFIAFFAQSAQYVSISVYDGNGNELAIEEGLIQRGFTWYELDTSVEIGSVEVRRGTISIGCPGCQDGGALDAIAFVGYRSGGSPRVEMPEERP